MMTEHSKVFNPGQQYKDTNNKLNILIVDDDKDSRDSLRDMIKIRGHNVTTLDEGMKSVNRCHANKYDLIFMDYHIDDIDENVGELSGTDVVRMIKECFDIESHIYAYTGDNTKQAIDDFKNTDYKGAFIKPIQTSVICEFLKIFESCGIKESNNNVRLRKLSIKNKNFIYFSKDV
jgi:CheY-like chemotaxis protein